MRSTHKQKSCEVDVYLKWDECFDKELDFV